MKNLNRLLKEKPNTKKVDLSFCQLTEIDSLMGELYRFKNMEELNLSCNRITKLPEDMSILKTLKKIDVTNNLLESNKEVLRTLKTIENLTSLQITCTPQEETVIIKELPKLNTINRNVLKKETAEMDLSGLLPMLGDLIKNQIETQRVDKETRQKTLRKRLRIDNEDIEEPQKIVPILMDAASKMNRSEEFKSIGSDFQDAIDKTKSKQRSLESMNISAYEQSFQIINCKYELVEVFFKPLSQMVTYANEDLGTAVRQVFGMIGRLHDTSQAYLGAANEMGGETSGGSPTKASRIGTSGGLLDTMNMEKEVWMLRKNELEKELSALREENKKCYDLIVKLSKNEADSVVDPRVYDSTIGAKTELRFTKKDEENIPIKNTTVKALTVNQLRDIIEDIMQSKKIFDKKQLASKIPRETLEQYLYTYLTNKYGLKSLVVSWATSIINMIGTHSKTDSLVLLFGKILRNEIEEEFYFEQMETVKTIRRLLESYLRSKHPLKITADLKKMCVELCEGLISKQQCIDMIEYLYAGKDVKAVEMLIDHLFAENVHEPISSKRSKPKVLYTSFEKVILDYQLHAHEDRLSNFRELYIDLDHQKKGVLEGDNVIKLLEQVRMRKCTFEVAAAKNRLDPLKCGKVTFSTFVEVLHTIPSEGTQWSLIQKLGRQELTQLSLNIN